MAKRTGLCVALAMSAFAACGGADAAEQQAKLPPPGFHHLHLNSVDPDAAIAFYAKEFPSTSKTVWGGLPALASPNNVLVLFTKVAAPPPADPQATAYWHFGWHVTDVRKNLELYKSRPEVKLAPLYTTDEGASVLVSSDTWPGTGGLLGLTKAQIAGAKAKGVMPLGGAGFAYMRGPDNALIEYQGNMPAERFNHVHMYQEDPFCAQLWYQTHLNAPSTQTLPAVASRAEINCKAQRAPYPTWPSLEKEGMYRSPSAGVTFGDVAMNWYMRQTDKPLVGTRGRLMDHVGLSVRNLDAWVAKLKSENVTFLEEPYKLGDTRAVMIEGPSHEAIELVEVK
ncbi:MAG TPA: VOC family protein [Micropepsaceae bacterium]|nr:VOC family protein [Micropepsaceae bacterium]